LLSRHGEPPEDRRPEHVILVDWDGFDPAYLERAPTPNLDALAEEGTLTTAKATFPTTSNSSRASMCTGANPEVHGNLAYYLDERSGEVVGQSRFLAAETLTEALADADKTTAAVQWYMVQRRGVSSEDPAHLYLDPGGLFATRVDAAIDVLEGRTVDAGGKTVQVREVPHFLAVYGSDLDAAGQTEGPDGPNVVPLLAEMDDHLGRLVRATQDLGIYDRTAFIVTGDHGMTGWDADLTPDVLATLTSAGYAAQAVAPGDSPDPATEIVLTTGAVRTAGVALQGRTNNPQERARIQAALEDAPRVAKVLGSTDLKDLRAGDRLGDFVLEAEEPWGFVPPGESSGGSRGAHGSTREMPVPLLLSGAGIRRDAAPRDPRLVDVAPTVCALLGTRPPKDAQGRALSEALGIKI
jgi:arylsulfatase A-like enzyme